MIHHLALLVLSIWAPVLDYLLTGVLVGPNSYTAPYPCCGLLGFNFVQFPPESVQGSCPLPYLHLKG